MSGPESEQVLALLQELSVLKELDKACESAPHSESEQRRQQRQQEIVEEIKAIAEQKNARNRSVEVSSQAVE